MRIKSVYRDLEKLKWQIRESGQPLILRMRDKCNNPRKGSIVSLSSEKINGREKMTVTNGKAPKKIV